MAPNYNTSYQGLSSIFSRVQPSLAFVVMIFGALISFEIFNYSTTDHALSDLLGNLKFAGIQWSTILALAFCGIDFAGIARLFTPETGPDEPKEVWYLFGAWLLAATMNAILTWWGVSIAVANHTSQSSAVIDPQTINNVVPIFVAIMVWVIRILIIGTLSLAMDRLLHPGAEQRLPLQTAMSRPGAQQHRIPVTPQPMSIPASLNSNGMQRPQLNRATAAQQRYNRNHEPELEEEFQPAPPARNSRPEPTYHQFSVSASPRSNRSNNGSQSETGKGKGSSENTGRYRRL